MTNRVAVDPEATVAQKNNLAVALGTVHAKGRHPERSPVANVKRALNEAAPFIFPEEDCTGIEVTGDETNLRVVFKGIKDFPKFADMFGKGFAHLYGLVCRTPISDPVEAFQETIAFVARGGDEENWPAKVDISAIS